MTKDQEDTLNMYQTVDGVLQTNNAIWSGNAEFTNAVGRLEDNIDTIEDLWDQQIEDITGVTADKQNQRVILEKITYKVGRIIVFWASNTNNRKVLKKVNFTRTELTRARDSELPTFSGQVHEEAVANSLVLGPYGLTALMITALQTAITDYMDILSKPREALTETSAATEQLPAIFTDTDKILDEQLDAGMELYVDDEPDFYTAYFNARIIVNSPTLKRALEVHIQDSVTDAAIVHAHVLVDAGILRRSSKLGNIRVQSLTEGSHHIKITLPGYLVYEADFNVISGETTKLSIVLVKV
jgi:hypothetical protein